MKDIKYIPIEEKSLNDKLVNLYGPLIPGLYSAVKPFFENTSVVKPALPLLIELYEDDFGEYPYEKADLRLMIFGRETNNWNDQDNRKSSTYTEYKYNFNIQNSDDIVSEISGIPDVIHGIGDIYGDYCYHDSSIKKTQFTVRKDILFNMIKEAFPNKKLIEVWNNIFKIGVSQSNYGRSAQIVPENLRTIEHKYFNVVAKEVEILKPEIIIFLTGKNPLADAEIRYKFGIGKDDFTPVKDGVLLDRINIPGVKYAARTIHPSRQSNENLKIHFDALIDDIKRNIL